MTVISTTAVDLLGSVAQLRTWARANLGGSVITVASGKGGVGKTTIAVELAYCLDGVLVDQDWDDGCAARALGWRHEDRVRSPFLDALDTGRLPRLISGGRSRPDLVPAGPDLETNQPMPELLADTLTTWARLMDRVLVVDTHPGRGDAAHGAMRSARAVVSPTPLGVKELDALAGWCGELEGYPVIIGPNRIQRIPPASQLDRLAGIAELYGLPVLTPVPDAPWLMRRAARTAVCSARALTARNTPVIGAWLAQAREVAQHVAAAA
jgi:chromosome partitioning protein